MTFMMWFDFDRKLTPALSIPELTLNIARGILNLESLTPVRPSNFVGRSTVGLVSDLMEAVTGDTDSVSKSHPDKNLSTLTEELSLRLVRMERDLASATTPYSGRNIMEMVNLLLMSCLKRTQENQVAQHS